MDQWAGQDDLVVRAAQAGDPVAMQALWARHRRWIAALLIQHKPSSADLEDLLQDVATQMVAKLHTLDQPGALPGWLRTTALNAARWAGRKQTVRDRHQPGLRTGAAGSPGWPGDVQQAPDGASGLPLQQRERSDEAGRLLDLARALPAEYAEPLLLRAVQGMSYRQIGEVLGLPETTIETRIARGRRMLKEAAQRGTTEGVRVRAEPAANLTSMP